MNASGQQRTFEFPVLIADIGGTFARFAVLIGPDAPLTPLVVVATNDHATPSLAIRSVLESLGAPRPRSALLGLAGRVVAPVARLTNAPWEVDAARLAGELGLSGVTLVNDYVPVAALLPSLTAGASGDLTAIGPDLPPGEGNRIALGPGTGLGAAACIPVRDLCWLQPTEAGHMSFGACEAAERALWPLIGHGSGAVSAETVLSGPGLVRLCRAIALGSGRASPWESPAAVISAVAEGDDAAIEAVRLFLRLLGRFAGDLALAFDATGGVYLGSGILPRILGLLGESDLRRAFEDKPPFQDALARIPTFVITRREPAMSGLAAMASAPDRFVFRGYGWPAAPS